MPYRTAIAVAASVITFLSICLFPFALQAVENAEGDIRGDSLNIARSSETSLAATPHALAPSITFKGSDPYIAWTEINSKGISFIYVKHQEGKEWVLNGGPLNLSSTRHAASPSIAASADSLYAAWSETAPGSLAQVYVKRWKGEAWGLIGAGLNLNPENHALTPVLAVHNSNLYAAWTEIASSGSSQIYVKQWDGISWTLIGNRLNKSEVRHAFTPSMTAAKSGVYLAWAEYDDNGVSQIYVSHWDGKGWTEVGKALNIDPERHALSPSLSGAGSTPYIAYMEYDREGISQIHVKRWDGKEWRQIGESLNVDPLRHATSPSLAMKGGVPCVAWTEIDENGISNLYMKQWMGSTWSQDVLYLNNHPERSAASPVIVIKDKEIHVAFSEMDADHIYQLYVKQLREGTGAAPAPPPIKRREATDTKKEKAPSVFFTRIPKDPAFTGLPPPLAYKYLPKTGMGEVDWMGGVREGLLNPFDSTDPDARPSLPPLYLDIPLPVKKGFGIPDAFFPHSSHTMWLDCRNCHPSIFTPKRGGNPITMHRVLEGEYCGRCHGIVAFRLYDCFRCHSR